ncbi:nesp073 [Neophasia sp. alphabaculovirus]|nr:nesp073 [Neophasia sp. alphabaculovirus]
MYRPSLTCTCRLYCTPSLDCVFKLAYTCEGVDSLITVTSLPSNTERHPMPLPVYAYAFNT